MAFRLAGALALVVTLSACGGGGGGDPKPPGAPPPEPLADAQITGTVATGLPLSGATVTLYDATGTAVTTDTTATDGSYRLTVPAATKAPLVLEAVKGEQKLVSMLGETKSSRVNITPITNVVAARLAADGNPASLRHSSGKVTPEQLRSSMAEIVDVIQPLRAAVGDGTEPLSGTFLPNGTGHDRTLETLNVSIRPTGTYSNIELSPRSAAQKPTASIFRSDTQGALAKLDPVAPEDLPPSGIGDMIRNLTDRLTACYAVPLEQRVSGATASTTAVTGTATSVIAPECRTLFLNDDPQTYLNNGAGVGRDANGAGAFNTLFTRSATGAVFDSGTLRFLRDNAEKDVVFTYRATNSATQSELFETLIARVVNGALKLIGNGYQYSSSVQPFVMDREYVNQPAADFIATGYNLLVANVLLNGQPIFSKVVVTRPDQSTVTLVPSAGRSNLVALMPNGTPTNANVELIAGRFKSGSTAGTPAQYEPSSNFLSPAYTDDQIAALLEHGQFKVEFFFADTSKPNVIQVHRTISRAPTLAEAAYLKYVELTSTARSELASATSGSGVFVFGPPSASNPNVAALRTSAGGDFWQVPEGAPSPFVLTVFGRGPDPDGAGPERGANYDDRITIPQNLRSAVIQCAPGGAGDNHCDSSTGTTQFAQGSTIYLIELFASGAGNLQRSKQVATYYPLGR